LEEAVMKKTTVLLLTVLTVIALALPLAAEGTHGSWTGWITDDKCGAKGANADHKGCSEKCLGEGHKLVFYNNADKKLYSLDKQDDAKANLGYEVKVTGEAAGSAIKVDSIAPSAPKAGS
jgi:hypothetical protein